MRRYFCARFLGNSFIDLDEIWCATITCWPIQAHAIFHGMINNQGREVHFSDSTENVFITSLRSHAYLPISVKRGWMVDTTRPISFS